MRHSFEGKSQSQFESLENRRLLAVDLLSDAAGLSAAQSTTVNGVSYFFANDGATGKELWKSDGTGSGTVLVKDLTPGSASSELKSIYNVNGHVVFITAVHHPITDHHLNDDYTLWTSDGTADGTVKLMDFKGVNGVQMAQAGDQLGILVSKTSTQDNSINDGTLYFTDGTAGGTRLVKNFPAVPGTDHSDSISFYAAKLLTSGNRVIFGGGNGEELWGSDGTANGTINLTSALGNNGGLFTSLQDMAQIGDKVLIPGTDSGNVYITDGTLAGTKHKNMGNTGRPDGGSSAVVGSTYYFVDVTSVNNDIRKILYGYNVDTGTLTNVYRSPGDGSDDRIQIIDGGSRLIFTDADSGKLETTMFGSDGTEAGTVALATFKDFAFVSQPISVAGSNYFIVANGPYVEDAEDTLGVTGWIGSAGGLHLVNAPGTSSIDLWRTDGTPETTGVVRTLWKGDANLKTINADISEANGKLVAEVKVMTGFILGQYPTDESKLTVASDETTAYDPKELSFGRQGATARLVNGVLRIGGSVGNDSIRMWRSSRDPNKLVVEYNGNERGFLFNSVSKVAVDLQDGNDRFEILEGEGGAIRLRTSVYGGDGADTIITGAGRDSIFGGSGGDLIRSRGNADEVSGGAGKDRINSGAGDDQIAGGTGVDQIAGGAGVDVLFGQTAIEAVFGQDLEGTDADNDVLLS